VVDAAHVMKEQLRVAAQNQGSDGCAGSQS
jgi:hypothetical protein